MGSRWKYSLMSEQARSGSEPFFATSYTSTSPLKEPAACARASSRTQTTHTHNGFVCARVFFHYREKNQSSEERRRALRAMSAGFLGWQTTQV